MKIKNKKDFGLGIFGILFSVWIAYYSFANIPNAKHDGDPGPRLFPLIGAGIMLICSIIILIKPDAQSKKLLTKEQWKAAGKIFGIYCLTALMFYLVGFSVTVPIILFILTYVLSKVSEPDMPKKERIKKAVIFAVIAGALIIVAYLVGLQASLPDGLLFELF